jgi:Fur family ferric uptake transcriptional regulator
VCTRCGAIEEFEDEAIEQLQAAAARRHGFVLDGHVFELYGRCRACRERQGRNT